MRCGLEWRALRDVLKHKEDARLMFFRTYYPHLLSWLADLAEWILEWNRKCDPSLLAIITS